MCLRGVTYLGVHSLWEREPRKPFLFHFVLFILIFIPVTVLLFFVEKSEIVLFFLCTTLCATFVCMCECVRVHACSYVGICIWCYSQYREYEYGGWRSVPSFFLQHFSHYLILKNLKNIFIYMFAWVCVYVCAVVLWLTCECHDNFQELVFFSHHTWIPGMELRISGLVAGAFPLSHFTSPSVS